MTSILLFGLLAAGANVLGGVILIKSEAYRWGERFLKYLVALGAGFMLATAIMEVIPQSLKLGGSNAAFLILVGYLIIHFFEHTVTPHFHFGEETHEDVFVHDRTTGQTRRVSVGPDASGALGDRNWLDGSLMPVPPIPPVSPSGSGGLFPPSQPAAQPMPHTTSPKLHDFHCLTFDMLCPLPVP